MSPWGLVDVVMVTMNNACHGNDGKLQLSSDTESPDILSPTKFIFAMQVSQMLKDLKFNTIVFSL